MKEKGIVSKRLILIAVIAVVLVAAIVFTCISLIEKDSEEEVRDIGLEVKAALDATLDFSQEENESNEILLKVESMNGYEIISCEKTEDGATATIRIYAPDLYNIAKMYDESNEYGDDKEKLKKLLLEKINDAEIVEKEATIDLIKTENGYEPVLTLEFLDAYYGGILKILNDAIASTRGGVAQ